MARKAKDKSRIPGVSVGEEVSTTVGEKKKVCFNIGGKWIFRMVDPGWRAPGRPTKKGRRAHGSLHKKKEGGNDGEKVLDVYGVYRRG